jgi:phenylalanyl-tRNA synthetase beta chain
MRYSLIPSLLEVWEYNISRNLKDVNIYEIGSRYSKLDDRYLEENMVSGLLYGNYLLNNWQQKQIKVDFYVVKGIIENLLNYLGLNRRYTFTTNNLLADLHPGRSCNIIVDNENIGFIGQVHPLISKKEIYVFELNIDKLFNKKVRNIKSKEINKYPSVNKDVAFIVKEDITSEQVASIIKQIGGRLLVNLEVFDVYTGENVANDEKSLAYALTFQDKDKTLSDEEVINIFNKIIKEVESKLQAKVRDK